MTLKLCTLKRTRLRNYISIHLNIIFCLFQHFNCQFRYFWFFAYVSIFLKKNFFKILIFIFANYDQKISSVSIFDKTIFSFEFLWRHKNGAKSGFLLITHDRHVKNITARLILYLDINTRLLSYHTINSVKQLFNKLFFILNAVEQIAMWTVLRLYLRLLACISNRCSVSL